MTGSIGASTIQVIEELRGQGRDIQVHAIEPVMVSGGPVGGLPPTRLANLLTQPQFLASNGPGTLDINLSEHEAFATPAPDQQAFLLVGYSISSA